ncbi:MAG: 23S rRNA (uracil(1939)-C(5))-methyltransferase RlmD [Candidatus Alkaliphilus sp. MAG34]
MLRKNDLIEFNIDRVAFPDKGEGEYEGQKVKVKGGIEGQKVEAKVSKKRKGHIEAKITNVLEKSPLETEIGCPHFGACGGCAYQTLTYENELKLKEKQILDLFNKEGLDINYLGIEESPMAQGYRNKMEYTFGDEEKDGPLALGLHSKGKFYEIVNVQHCNIVDTDFTNILTIILEYFRKLNMPHYKKKTHEGFLRHLVVRKALSTGEILINIVTSSQGQLDREDFVSNIIEKSDVLIGKIVGILHTTNDNLSDAVRTDKLETLYGRDYIVEEILGLKFNISPFSFFQTNTLGAEKLYSIVREFAGDVDDKIIFDLYSGIGTIAQIMAPMAKKVIGIEIVEEAINNARENAKLNNLNNVEFIGGDVLKVIDELEDKPDLIIIDPPREGIQPKAIRKIIDFNPVEFIYVSCNPVTLVRDLKVFVEGGYKIDKVKCVDQFPRTVHVETIALLQREIS